MLKLEGIKLVVGKGTQLERTILEDLFRSRKGRILSDYRGQWCR